MASSSLNTNTSYLFGVATTFVGISKFYIYVYRNDRIVDFLKEQDADIAKHLDSCTELLTVSSIFPLIVIFFIFSDSCVRLLPGYYKRCD